MTRTLTRKDWLDHALQEVASKGPAALRAQSLAKSLGVSRGSFYWHFADIDAFHDALIAHWSVRTNDSMMADILATISEADQLTTLLMRTFRSGAALERALRAWATHAPKMAERIAEVDARRIGYAVDILERAGLADAEAVAWARLLYWAAIGRLMMPDAPHRHLSDAEITGLAKLMERA